MTVTELTQGSNLTLVDNSVVFTIDLNYLPNVDLSVLLLGENGKVSGDSDFVFYNQPSHFSGAANLNITPSEGIITVDLSCVHSTVEKIVVIVSSEVNFGTLPPVKTSLSDTTGNTFAEYTIINLSSETAVIVGEVYRRNNNWKFRAVGQGYNSGLAGVATDFGISVDDEPAPTATTNTPSPTSPTAPTAPTAPVAPAAPTPVKLTKLINMEKKLETQSPELLSLTKKASVSLAKKGLDQHTAKVALCLDISMSMRALYSSGKIAELAKRVLGLGLRFDDDGEVDVFLFGQENYQAGVLDVTNYANYIPQMLGQQALEPATYYGKVMERVRNYYFGSSPVPGKWVQQSLNPRPQPVPVYVMFVTDGAPHDPGSARDQMIGSSYDPIFWQFMAIGETNNYGRSEFAFLQELDDMEGRFSDNADFFTVADPAQISEEQLYDLMVNEYPGWVSQAKQKGILT